MKEPFFAYFTWRFSYELQKKETDIVLWWEAPEANNVSPQQKIQLVVHQMNSMDLPTHKHFNL